MNERFVAIDVETANADLASLCQIGIVEFEGTVESASWSTVLDPEDEFDAINISIHGIDEHVVRNAPTLPKVADRIRSDLSGCVVLSHMPFDRLALSRGLARYGLPPIECTWLDTARVARRVWPQFSRRGYGLANVASWCGIEFQHHDALEDARAAALIMLQAANDTELSVADWVAKAQAPIGGSSRTRSGDQNATLAGEVIVFTGALSIPRREAADLAAAAGCDVASTVGTKVTILVIGDQDVRKLAGHQKSSKHRKAEGLIESGQPIRILRESDFRELIAEPR